MSSNVTAGHHYFMYRSDSSPKWPKSQVAQVLSGSSPSQILSFSAELIFIQLKREDFSNLHLFQLRFKHFNPIKMGLQEKPLYHHQTLAVL
jgi:hypothetical protein